MLMLADWWRRISSLWGSRKDEPVSVPDAIKQLAERMKTKDNDTRANVARAAEGIRQVACRGKIVVRGRTTPGEPLYVIPAGVWKTRGFDLHHERPGARTETTNVSEAGKDIKPYFDMEISRTDLQLALRAARRDKTFGQARPG
jgi:hypothetical protein